MRAPAHGYFCGHKVNSNFQLLGTLLAATLFLISATAGEVITCESGLLSPTHQNQTQSQADNVDRVHCTLETTQNKSVDFNYECLDNETVRIVGEYQVVRLLCSAPFPLDLEYNGFQPTEAIQVYFSKEIEPNSSRKLIAYKFEVHVRSVAALHELYGAQHKENRGSARPSRQLSSRTGRFTIHDVFNKTRQWSVYLFLEDEPDALSLMRNRFSSSVLVTHHEDPVNSSQKNDSDTTMMNLVIPCRPSHLHANVSLFMKVTQNGSVSTVELAPNGQNVTYSPKKGFTLTGVDLPATGDGNAGDAGVLFTCNLKDANENMKLQTSLQFIYPPDDKAPQFGFEGLPTGSIQENINIHPQIVVVDNYNFQISMDCIVDNPKDAILQVIESRTPSHSRLVQEFVFPKYINRSYTGVIGINSSPPGVLTVKRVGMAGLVFCMSRRIVGNDTDYKVLEYATGFDRKVRFFKYGQDWSFFDVTASPAVNHLQIQPGTLISGTGAPGTYYIGQVYQFRIRVRIHGLAPPVIWYRVLDNGTIIEEFIDYNLDPDHFSHYNLTITETTKEIIAAASFWDRQLWKNVSTPIAAGRKEGLVPLVTNTNFAIQFIHGASNQVLKCEVTGDPTPTLVWEKGSQVLAPENGTHGTGSLILEFRTVDYSQGGEYICRAANVLGSTSRTFTVEVVDEERPNLVLSIGIPTFVFIIATLGTYLYFRYIRKENVGLTAKEIEAFEQGSPEFTKEMQMDYMVPDNALNIPYNRDYEIEERDFQIATSEELGSGQFGVVYKAIVKGTPTAVKTLKPNADKDYLKALLSELKIMCYLGKHEHVVELIGANTSKLKKGNVYLFVELCSESLEKHLFNNRGKFIPDSQYKNTRSAYIPLPPPSSDKLPFDTQQLYIWSYQISKAMEYLESKKVIHGDLATRNVLLSADGQAKVTDFGLSRQLYNYSLYVKKNQEPLPWRWMAVESLRDFIFSVHSDAWSFGVTLWEIFSLAEIPYPGLSWDVEFVEKLERGLRMLKPRHGTQKFYEDVLLQCWHTDPECRPSFEFLSQYILNLIHVKPIPPHYIRYSDCLTKKETETNASEC